MLSLLRLDLFLGFVFSLSWGYDSLAASEGRLMEFLFFDWLFKRILLLFRPIGNKNRFILISNINQLCIFLLHNNLNHFL